MDTQRILKQSFLADLYILSLVTVGVCEVKFHSAVQDEVMYNFYNGNITTWTDSEKQCRKNGGQLVTLETERKWKFVKEEIQNLSNSAHNEWFIGLKTGYRKRQNWQWITGQQLTNPHWQNHEPSGDGQCAVIAKENPPGTYGKYNDLSCLASKAFICEFEVNTTTGNNIVLKWHTQICDRGIFITGESVTS